MAKSFHDRNVKVLPDLEIGQEVQLSPLQRGKPWKAGTCVAKLSDRPYMVEADGELFQTNRLDLKPTQENPPADRPEPVPQPASESYVAAAATPAPSQQQEEQAFEILNGQQDLQTTFVKKTKNILLYNLTLFAYLEFWES